MNPIHFNQDNIPPIFCEMQEGESEKHIFGGEAGGAGVIYKEIYCIYETILRNFISKLYFQ
jgi:hypothetical protein